MNASLKASSSPANFQDTPDAAHEEALAAAIIRYSDDAIIAKSLDGTVLSWNAGATRVFGFTSEEMIGQPVIRLFPAELRYEEETLVARIRAGQVVNHFETRRLRKDGTECHVSVMLSPIRDRAGNIVAVSKIARDITSQRREREAESLAAALVENSHDGIIVMDAAGLIKGWNRAAERIYGYTAAEIIGSSTERLVPAHLREQEAALLQHVKSGQGDSNVLTQRMRRDGAMLEVSLTFSPVLDGRGHLLAIAKTVRNFTVRTQLLDRLRKVSKELAGVRVTDLDD